MTEESNEYYMLQALREARKAYEQEEVPVGAVIVLEGRIISRGHNQVEKLTDATAHAEIIALTSAFNFLGSKYLPQASIYITVEPCLMCAGALYWSKIGRVIYGTDDEKNGYRKYTNPPGPSPADPLKTGPWPFHPRTELVKGILQEECARLMKDFFRSKR